MKIDTEKSKFYSFSDPMEDLYMCGALNVGKRGYFSDNPDFADCVEGVLGSMVIHEEHDDNNYFPFRMKGYSTTATLFRFFCPRAYAVEKPRAPELRPYRTLNELPFKVGDSVTFREKNSKYEWMLICSVTVIGDELWLERIHLGAHIFEPQDLFEDYEWYNGKEWKPFGVEA